jgi:hypothetical protein
MDQYKSIFEMAIKHTFKDAPVSVKEKARLIVWDALDRTSYWREDSLQTEEMTEDEMKMVDTELDRLVEKLRRSLRIDNINNKADRKLGK